MSNITTKQIASHVNMADALPCFKAFSLAVNLLIVWANLWTV
jgi:hypothetical protein